MSADYSVQRQDALFPKGVWPVFLLGLILYVAGTWQGIGLRPDSVIYLSFWDEGRQQGPVYSMLIDLAAQLGGDRVVLARLVNLGLLLLNLSLFAHILVAARVRTVPMIAGMVALLFLPQFLYVHQTVLSEPLALALLLGALIFTARVMETGSWTALVLAAVLTALALLTRFSSAPLIGACALAILVYGREPLSARLIQSVVYGTISSGAFLAWVAVDRIMGGAGVDRKFALLGEPDLSTLMNAVTTVATFFLPAALPMAILAGTVTLFLAAIVLCMVAAFLPARPGLSQPAPAIVRLSMLFVPLYLAFVVFTLFVEYGLTVHSRYILPVYAMVLFSALALFGDRDFARAQPRLARAFVAAVIAVAALNVVRGTESSYELMVDGNYYQSEDWRQSPTLARVRDLPPETKIYSDGPDAIRIIARRRADFWPRHYDSRTGLPHPDYPYDGQMATIREELARGEAVVVAFDGVDWRKYLATEQEMIDTLDLNALFDEEDGRIYGNGDVLSGR
ncbi:glycosyltransferase family 39 protein [Palleronia rufa]|uniref:glycosyltransferase family 39 protein n=1 Tax=Palleronia rufa TaxID=1530186 RepID=UPI00056D7F86|nr:glycosyltransferase family 39 protein [Palleronia rufa]